ncbi:pleckstrin [Conger conger]|nr:pleckstrin [Conger conger]
MEPKQIRAGYLVKKRSLLNSWKVVWVVLSDDGVEFYAKMTDSTPKGMIPLKGATLTSPCQDFGRKMLVFKVAPKGHQAHFFQASHLEERELWTKDIKRTMACLERGMKFTRKSTRRSIRLPETVNLSEMYNAMRNKDSGLEEMTLEQDKSTFNHCFTGCMVIDWLVSAERARNRQEALMLAIGLLNEGFLQPAGELSKTAAESKTESTLLDQPDAIYYFADSGFYSEGNSSDDEVLLNEEFRGVIVKQGCLLKQGHRRKNWKVRKFTLRDDPAYLHYYDPTKDAEEPLGSVHLRGSVVTALEYVPDAKKSEVEGNLFEIITSNEVHYFLQATTENERKEWIQAIQVVSKTGK